MLGPLKKRWIVCQLNILKLVRAKYVIIITSHPHVAVNYTQTNGRNIAHGGSQTHEFTLSSQS